MDIKEIGAHDYDSLFYNHMQYLALLRGINVGGNNIIKMADLKACFEKMGFTDVATYIQSGNVLFCTPNNDITALTHIIESALYEQFGYALKIVLLSYSNLAKIIENAPPKFGSDIEQYRYDFLFLKPPLTAQDALKEINPKEGVDEVRAAEGILYFSRLISKATQSRLNKLAGTPVYKSITIRNWNTTTKLYEMMGGRK